MKLHVRILRRNLAHGIKMGVGKVRPPGESILGRCVRSLGTPATENPAEARGRRANSGFRFKSRSNRKRSSGR
jgi:hypothetical protein